MCTYQGITTTLFHHCLKSHLLALRPARWTLPGLLSAFKSAEVSRKLQLIFAIALFTCGTLNIVGLAAVCVIAALDYPLYPGGAYLWVITHSNEPANLLAKVPFMVGTWLAEGFMVREYIVIYLLCGWRSVRCG